MTTTRWIQAVATFNILLQLAMFGAILKHTPGIEWVAGCGVITGFVMQAFIRRACRFQPNHVDRSAVASS